MWTVLAGKRTTLVTVVYLANGLSSSSFKIIKHNIMYLISIHPEVNFLLCTLYCILLPLYCILCAGKDTHCRRSLSLPWTSLTGHSVITALHCDFVKERTKPGFKGEHQYSVLLINIFKHLHFQARKWKVFFWQDVKKPLIKQSAAPSYCIQSHTKETECCN